MNEKFNYVRLLNERQLCTYIGLGRNKAREFGEKCGAKKKIGGRVLFDKNIIDKAIEEL